MIRAKIFGVTAGQRVYIGKHCSLKGKHHITFEDSVTVRPYTQIWSGGGTVRIGKGSEIGERCRISIANSLEIGEKVLLSPNVYITDCDHEYRNVDIPIIDQGIVQKGQKVSIGDGSYIGIKATKYWPLQKYCGFYNTYDEFLLKKKLAELAREKYKPDIIILEWTQCVLTRELVHNYFPGSKIVASEHDLSVVGFQRKVEAAEKGFTAKKLEDLKRLELGALAQCDMTFFHSREDLKRAKNMMPQCKDKFSSIVPYYDD